MENDHSLPEKLLLGMYFNFLLSGGGFLVRSGERGSGISVLPARYDDDDDDDFNTCSKNE